MESHLHVCLSLHAGYINCTGQSSGVICEYEFEVVGDEDTTQPHLKFEIKWGGKECIYDLNTASAPPSEDCSGVNFSRVTHTVVEIETVLHGLVSITIMTDRYGHMCNDTLNVGGM